MKTIKMKCSCGAEIEMNDSHGSYINSGGQADEKGRVFLIEVRASEWLDRHQGCVRKSEARSAPF
ncbi:MAG: hypothetical protein WC329_02835 [Candidatus Omnitrophota bacterium]|jgi:hypothetical protein